MNRDLAFFLTLLPTALVILLCPGCAAPKNIAPDVSVQLSQTVVPPASENRRTPEPLQSAQEEPTAPAASAEEPPADAAMTAEPEQTGPALPDHDEVLASAVPLPGTRGNATAAESATREEPAPAIPVELGDPAPLPKSSAASEAPSNDSGIARAIPLILAAVAMMAAAWSRVRHQQEAKSHDESPQTSQGPPINSDARPGG